MPAKKKTAKKAKPEEGVKDAPPEATAPPQPEASAREAPPTGFVWPKKEQDEVVTVPLDESTKAQYAVEFAGLETRRLNVTSEKKEAMAGYKSRLEGINNGIEVRRTAIESGVMRKSLRCRWIFEACGYGPDGTTLLRDPNQKVLIRPDTKAIIRVAPITDEERQSVLNFEKTEEECEAELQSLGWIFCTEDAPAEGCLPFFIRPIEDKPVPDGQEPPDDTVDITGDNRKDALRNAVLWLTSHLEAKDHENITFLNEKGFLFNERDGGLAWEATSPDGKESFITGDRRRALQIARDWAEDLLKPEDEAAA